MNNKVIINLPVRDLDRSIKFFKKLGFEADERFSGRNTYAFLINEMTYVMLFNEDFFTRFSRKKTNETTDTSEVVISISVDKPAHIKKIVEKAVMAGASALELYDMDWVKGWGFTDPDRHTWEILYINKDKIPLDKGIRDNEIEYHYEHQWY